MRTRQPEIEIQNQPKIPETVVGATLKIEGELKSEGDIRIDGEVRGSVTTKGDVYIGPQAMVSATVQAANAIVAGRVNGDVSVTKQLTLESTARLKGNTTSSELVIARGAQFNGLSAMSSGEASVNKPLITPSQLRSVTHASIS